MSDLVRAVDGGRPGAARGALVAVAALALALMTASPAGAATNAPSFARSDHASLATNHVAADFNGDGRADLAGIGAQSAAVLLGTGGGAFGPRAEYPVASWAQDLAAGDFDSDGHIDLAVTVNDPQVSISLLMGNGDGTFAPRVDLANTSGFDSPAIVAAHLDRDAALDLVVAHQIACYTAPCRVARTLDVLLGNGDGTFQPARAVEVGTGMSRIAVGDFDRDGVRDLAIAGDQSRLYRLRGVGDGTFVQQPTITMTADTLGVDATDVDLTDFNGDGIGDLAVAIALNGSRTAILIGNGDGTFRAPLILTEPNLMIPQVQALGDYNGDGFADLALGLGNGTRGLFEIRNGNGDGTFQSPVMYLVPPDRSSIGTIALVSANLDGDGRPDLALGFGGATAGLVVLRNTTGSVPPATPTAPALRAPAQDATVSQPVTLDWSDIAGAASYRVQVDDSSTFSSPLVLDATATASQLAAPTLAARRHWWRVRAVNSAGTAGPWSTVRRFTPRAATGAPATLTVTATGRSGQRVTSSPAGISVSVGSTGSASFATGTAITLSVTNSREAIWSGACSSGGRTARTCRFTLGGDASVTANVR